MQRALPSSVSRRVGSTALMTQRSEVLSGGGIDRAFQPHFRSRQPLVAPNVGAPSDMDVDEVLQLLVKNVDPSAARIAEGLVVDVAVADEEVFFKTRHTAFSESHHRLPRR